MLIAFVDFWDRENCKLMFLLQDNLYLHYEKLGIGSNKAFEYNNLQMQHNKLHFFNFHVTNVLGYQTILSSHSIITDFTPPHFTESKHAAQLNHIPLISLYPPPPKIIKQRYYIYLVKFSIFLFYHPMLVY